MLKKCLQLGIGVVLASSAVFSHHSVAMFDHTKKVAVEGIVKEWQWTNPHAWLQIVAPDSTGALVEQGFELGSPNTLVRDGFKMSSFKPGDKVRVLARPRRDGTVGGMYLCAKTAEGQWLIFGSPDSKPQEECKG